MSLFIVVQTIVLSLLGAGCSLGAFARFCPGLWQRMRTNLAWRLEQPDAGRFRQRLVRRIMPDDNSVGGCGSGGCSACSGCALKARLQTIAPGVSKVSNSEN